METAPMKLKLQVVIAGYGSQPSTVFALLQSDLLAIGKVKDGPHEARFQDSTIISNGETPGRDVMFSEEHFADSIDAFFTLKNSGLLQFARGTEKSTPNVDNDGFTEAGRKYRVSADITSAQVATLAACWYVKRAKTIIKMESMADQLLALQRGAILTI